MRILEMIEDISDPRMEGKVRHKLSTIIFVALCGVLCGCESWNDMRDYCKAKKNWLSQYVSLANGIPSGYTFRRVFTLLNPDSVEYLLRTHAAEIVNKGKASEQIAIDGKALRGSKRLDIQCLHSVSAWCHENGLILAERQTESKSNEITAIPLLLESLDLKGNTVTIDAVGCQKSITKLITRKKGNYVLGFKSNHPKFYEAVKEHIKQYSESAQNRLYDAFDDSHGKSVRRRYFGYNISSLPEAKKWSEVQTVVAVETISSKNNDPSRKVSAEWRYYLSNHQCTDKRLPHYIRNHWSIENRLHWVLDVHLKEDDDQKAERKSARSFSLLKRIALNIVRTKDTTPKKSLRRKLKHSAWDDDYLLSMLS
ncbi:MAG TPA: ISAs1 family transposase [Candidatus Babeliales bacterium]|nr:ISAs1 family transposase [Candidatus Babeliales bacterium]